jgi:hypothetical protein
MEVIRARTSERSYDGRPLEPDDRDKLTRFIEKPTPGPFGNFVRLALVEASEADRAELRALGTYGMVKGARSFLAGAVEAGPGDMEDYGFAFERAVLYATSLGVGTCWLGASFNRSGFAGAIDLGESEILPAVSPVGYPARSRTVVDATTRFFARSRKRKRWAELFFDGDADTPLSPEAAGPYAEVLEMVRLGPSASNRQPWRLVRGPGGEFHFFLKRTPGYNSKLINVPGGDLQRLDMGIAMLHFKAAARTLDLPGNWARVTGGAGHFGEKAEYVASWRAEG